MKKILVAVALVSVGFVQADAGLISVDPDSFVDNTNISNAFVGVVLSEDGTSPGAPVFANTDSNNSTASNVFGRNFGGTIFSNWLLGQREFRADFGADTAFVSIDAIKIFGGGTAASADLRAFSSGGILLDTATTDFGGAAAVLGTVATLSLTRITEDVAFIIAGGTGSNSANLDLLKFTVVDVVVPEPSTLILFAMTAACLLAFGYRRRSMLVA